MKRAFTIIELIITMVILAIVAYIASGLIAKTYIGYNHTNTINRANLKLEMALNEITNRLEYAIANSIVKRKSATDKALSPISSAPSDYEVLEWVGMAKDSFNANNDTDKKPAWSGFCNVDKSSKNSIVTAASNLALADDIINRLSINKANLNSSNVAIFFMGEYDYNDIGYETGANSNRVGIIKSYSNNKLDLANNIESISEHYKIAWSAYAVVPTNCTAKGCDLELRYNFRPWMGEHYENAPSTLLVNNVTVFKTYATQNRVHIKLCVKDRYNQSQTTSICKEKVVFK